MMWTADMVFELFLRVNSTGRPWKPLWNRGKMMVSCRLSLNPRRLDVRRNGCFHWFRNPLVPMDFPTIFPGVSPEKHGASRGFQVVTRLTRRDNARDFAQAEASRVWRAQVARECWAQSPHRNGDNTGGWFASVLPTWYVYIHTSYHSCEYVYIYIYTHIYRS